MTGHLLHTDEYRSKLLCQTWLTTSGMQTTFFRLSSRALAPPPPLLSTCELTFERPPRGPEDTPFVKEWHLLNDRSTLSRPWKRMQAACFFAAFLKLNATHFPDPADTYAHADTVFDAFPHHPIPTAILLKGMIKLLRAEGFPVIEAWYSTQPARVQTVVAQLMNHPISAPATHALSDDALAQSWRSLSQWLERSTEFISPQISL